MAMAMAKDNGEREGRSVSFLVGSRVEICFSNGNNDPGVGASSCRVSNDTCSDPLGGLLPKGWVIRRGSLRRAPAQGSAVFVNLQCIGVDRARLGLPCRVYSGVNNALSKYLTFFEAYVNPGSLSTSTTPSLLAVGDPADGFCYGGICWETPEKKSGVNADSVEALP